MSTEKLARFLGHKRCQCEEHFKPSIESLVAACEARGWAAQTGYQYESDGTMVARAFILPGFTASRHLHADGDTPRDALVAAIEAALEDE